jgi:hypothetical protein
MYRYAPLPYKVKKPAVTSRAMCPVLRIRDPVLFYPLDPGSGSGLNFFPIPDPAPFLMKFSYNIFRINVMLSL